MTIKDNKNKYLNGITTFRNTVAALRDPKNGCPWDLAQDHNSLLKYFFEEIHEYAEAMRNYGPSDSRTWEELGDVLLQVVLHAQLAEESGYSDLDKIAAQAAQKTRSRHPHVFDPQFPRFKNAEEVSANWEKIKAWAAKTSAHSNPSRSINDFEEVTIDSKKILEDVPPSLPPLLQSSRLGEKAANLGFDWPDALSALQKVTEECQEVEAELNSKSPTESTHIVPSERALKNSSQNSAVAEELGDLLFAAVQVCRKLELDPEECLLNGCHKFRRRFEAMDDEISAQQQNWEDFNLEGLEVLWKKTKALTLRPGRVK